MRDIRQKPEDREPKTLKRASRIPKTFLRDIAEKSRAKTVEEMRSAPFDSRQEESSNTPANNAGEQMVSTGKNIVQKGADLAFRGGKNLARKMRERAVYRVKQRDAGDPEEYRERPKYPGKFILCAFAGDTFFPF